MMQESGCFHTSTRHRWQLGDRTRDVVGVIPSETSVAVESFNVAQNRAQFEANFHLLCRSTSHTRRVVYNITIYLLSKVTRLLFHLQHQFWRELCPCSNKSFACGNLRVRTKCPRCIFHSAAVV